MQPAFHKSGGILWQSWDEMDKENSRSRAEPLDGAGEQKELGNQFGKT